ncbi:NARE ribosyltransferase, partial [Heliornis fulica]|nr:NARE ribosyltransferase [Heliornis fulica]
MEHVVLGLVLLSSMLATASHPYSRDPVTKMMDMAPDSFDDQYQDCSSTMMGKLKDLNNTEFAINKIYAEAWKVAVTELQSQKVPVPHSPVLQPVHVIALRAYTLEKPALYRDLNEAVRRGGSSRQEYLNNFHFKVMHFLLSEALRKLRSVHPTNCYNVYRGIGNIKFEAQRDQSVRFGYFTSTSILKEKAEMFGKATLFSVKTCYGVPIWDYSKFPGEKEVLIPPFEVFKVTDVTQKGKTAIIELSSLAAQSKYNCEFVKEKRCKNQRCVFSA